MVVKNQDIKTEYVTNIQFDTLETPLVIPTGKLDADQYSADDLDGVTESVFGSGNLAYGALQASQTDEMLNVQDSKISDEKADINTDRPVEYNNDVNFGQTNDGNFANSTVGSLSASQLSSGAGAFQPKGSGLTLEDGLGIKNASGLKTAATQAITNSPSVQKSNDGGNIDNSSSNSVTNDNSQTINITEENLTEIINQEITEIGDIINNLTTQITEITDILGDTVNNLDLTQITEITESLTQNITNTLTEITGTTENVANIINDVLDGGEISLDLDLDILDALGSTSGITISDSIEGNINISAVTDNIADIVNDLSGLNPAITPDSAVNIGFDLLNNSDGADGNDINISGLETPDIALDPVEDIVGDINIDVNLPTELADIDTLENAADETLSGMNNLDLANTEEILDTLGEQNIDGALDAVANEFEVNEIFDLSIDEATEITTNTTSNLTNDLGNFDNLDTSSNTIEEIIADIADSDIDGVLSLLNSDNPDNSNETGSTDNETNWTESTIDESGLFDDLTGGLSGDADILPYPSGTVAEGLGALNVEPELDSGSLGGLFG
ncbi:MAG: hypothetical protein R3E13_07025 [Alphaproteobacteria bacterium]